MVIDLAASRCPRSKPDWALWPAVPASCTADDEAGYGAPSTPRFQPGCDAWCGSSRDKRLHRSEWQRPPPGLCRRSAPSADDRARSVAQRHPVHAPARGGPGKARLAACADTAKPAAHLGRGRQQLSRRCHPTPERRSSVLLVDLDVRNRVAQQRSHFFLNFDDQLGVLQLLGQTGNDGFLLAVLLDQWTDNYLGAALLGSKGVELSLFSLPSPGAQMRGVEALAAQQGAHRADILGGIGLVKNRALILGAETATMRTSNHFRIGNQRPGGRQLGARGVDSFSATLRSCQRRGRNTCLAFAYQSEIYFPALQ